MQLTPSKLLSTLIITIVRYPGTPIHDLMILRYGICDSRDNPILVNTVKFVLLHHVNSQSCALDQCAAKNQEKSITSGSIIMCMRRSTTKRFIVEPRR